VCERPPVPLAPTVGVRQGGYVDLSNPETEGPVTWETTTLFYLSNFQVQPAARKPSPLPAPPAAGLVAGVADSAAHGVPQYVIMAGLFSRGEPWKVPVWTSCANRWVRAVARAAPARASPSHACARAQLTAWFLVAALTCLLLMLSARGGTAADGSSRTPQTPFFKDDVDLPTCVHLPRARPRLRSRTSARPARAATGAASCSCSPSSMWAPPRAARGRSGLAERAQAVLAYLVERVGFPALAGIVCYSGQASHPLALRAVPAPAHRALGQAGATVGSELGGGRAKRFGPAAKEYHALRQVMVAAARRRGG
jgi:hypothetical protein